MHTNMRLGSSPLPWVHQQAQPRVCAQLLVQVVVLLQRLLLVPLQALVQDGDAELEVLERALVLLLLRGGELLLVARVAGLFLGQRSGLLVQAGLRRNGE